jgi:hypothetical protein
MLEASVWKYSSENDGSIYRMQINGPDGKLKDIVNKSLGDWIPSGEGWNNDGQILFFIKKFEDSDKWEEWVKKFKDFNLKVLDREGKTKKQIKSDNNIAVVETAAKRVCSKCKLPGHNAATCKNYHRKMTTQPQNKVDIKNVPSVALVEKGQRTCSLCNQKGHNARTCKSK